MLKTNVHDHKVFRLKLDELKRLVETLDVEVVGDIVQSRHRPFAKFHVGSGKVKEIRRKVQRHDVSLVVFYNILRSSQKLNLIRALGVDVVDRYEVTLEIFDQMASDNLSKLQIEAARLAKLAPYFRLEANLRYHNDRPFFRSMGEYAFHSQMRELTGVRPAFGSRSRLWRRRNARGSGRGADWDSRLSVSLDTTTQGRPACSTLSLGIPSW